MENKQYSDPCYDKYKNVLKGAKYGEVVTRFPPEPSGYLHIGHVKAAMLNYHYAKMYGGKMILRFDDTNPMNEKIEFVENITKDLETLGIKPDKITFTSDHFDHIKEQMDKLINLGLAYADDTGAEEMKAQRDEGIESKYRQSTVEQNLKIFQEMVAGKAPTFCIRAKMNMQDKVKCLRDPVFYRCKDQVHHKTGDKYKAYPTYDFACPIVDALEGVTWALRSIEYRDRAALYDWVLNKLSLRKVNLYEFSRLNLVSTVLSKRMLKWFVEGGLVDGWSDPRFPTVQGIMRRGMTSDSLKLFMLDQGASKNTNMMEWDKIWAFNKDIIDPQSKRYNAIVKSSACHMVIENGPETTTIESHPYHAKNPQLGQKPVIYSKNLYIEKDDAESIAEGEKVTLMKWGNATVSKKVVDGDKITLHATIDPADKDFKKTKKISWIANDPSSNVEVTLNELDHLITK
jgi:glutamyl-tRNA synthetase